MIPFMKNSLVTEDETKVLTVGEYEKFIHAVPESKRAILRLT